MRGLSSIMCSLVFPLLIACGKNESKQGLHPANKLPDSPFTVQGAVADDDLPADIREHIIVLNRVVAGEKADESSVRDAFSKLACVRNEHTCAVWIAFMQSCLDGLPKTLPTIEEAGRYEENVRDKSDESYQSNPLRFVFLLQICLTTLTEFDMPAADQAVKQSLESFEKKHGAAHCGRHFLKYYHAEIRNAEGLRKAGISRWMLKRDGKNLPNEY